MKQFTLAIFLTISGAFFSTSGAMADPKPRNANVTAGQELAKLYGGNTQTWEGCQGGIFYGAKGEAQAYCEKHPDSVGVGTWRIDGKGRVCHKLNWYWSSDGALVTKQDNERCITHRTAEDGIVWRSWPDDNEWWKATGSKSLVKGFKFKSKIRRLRKKLKV